MIKVLTAALGILVASRLPVLPPANWTLPQAWFAVVIISLPLLLLCWSRHTRVIACFCLGLSYGIVSGHLLLTRQLPPELEGEELLVSGIISGLPEDRGGYQRFPFTISEFHNLNPAYIHRHSLPENVILSWYGSPELNVAQRWTLKLKLSRPRGFVNSGGFDYQRWLLSSGVGATGYVRPSTLNQLHGEAAGLPVQKRREAIRGWLTEAADSPANGLLLALAVGDKTAISPAQWDLLRATGTNHLMAISGLHIGLLAFVGYWFGHLCRALVSLCNSRSPWVYWLPGLLSCAAALVYSALAGFALPTQRALTMVLLVNLAMVLSRGVSPMRALAWAMLVVLILDPLAGYDLGFWLSFGAVAFLLFHFQHRVRRVESPDSGATPALLRRFWVFGRAQWVVFVGLTIPLVALNQPLGLISPLANFFAIPLVSFAVVVPLLAGIALQALSEGAAVALVKLAGESLEFCMAVLARLADLTPSSGWFPAGVAPGPVLLILAGAGALLLLAPRGIPGRWLGGLLLLPLILPSQTPRPPLTLTVLDVGQGLAAVVATENHVLVYDTGPAFSERFNAAEAVITPHLRARGLRRIDRLIVSHGDGDHAGGVRELLANVATGELLSGEILPESKTGNMPTVLCDRDMHWQWDGVRFSLIEPRMRTANSNDHSCILLVEFAGRRILLPGDIASAVEASLLAKRQLPADIEVLIAPHHGSASSSSRAFVNVLRPRHVVFSAAYRSPYGHPHSEVSERYRAVGSVSYTTGHSGELSFVWDREGRLEITALRESAKRYWYADSEF